MSTERGKTYPNPDDTNPATRDTVDVSEAPVGVDSDDRRNELSQAEGEHEGVRRALHEEEAVRTGDEDERLRDDGDLEVDDRVQLPVVRVDGEGSRKRNAELVLEEGRLLDDDDKRDPESAVSNKTRSDVKRTTYVDIVR